VDTRSFCFQIETARLGPNGMERLWNRGAQLTAKLRLADRATERRATRCEDAFCCSCLLTASRDRAHRARPAAFDLTKNKAGSGVAVPAGMTETGRPSFPPGRLASSVPDGRGLPPEGRPSSEKMRPRPETCGPVRAYRNRATGIRHRAQDQVATPGTVAAARAALAGMDLSRSGSTSREERRCRPTRGGVLSCRPGTPYSPHRERQRASPKLARAQRLLDEECQPCLRTTPVGESPPTHLRSTDKASHYLFACYTT
jgi:hypothetical protein